MIAFLQTNLLNQRFSQLAVRDMFRSSRSIVMQEASDALSKTADSNTVSTYQVSSVQLVTDKTNKFP